MSDHDSPYKLLFSHKQMITDLLRGFVKEPWVDEMDLRTLKSASSFLTGYKFQDRQGDVVWQVKFRDGWLYVYLFLEFQSTVDKFMALRMLVYVGLFHQRMIMEEQLTSSGRLHPILPLVLYNGNRCWTPPPTMQYLLIDESRYTEQELSPLQNVAAALFRLENSRDPKQIGQITDLLAEWLKSPGKSSLRRAFTEWLRLGFLPARLPGIEIPQFANLQEVHPMLAEHVKEWTVEWKEQGRQEGLLEGEARLLLRQLECKFGTLSRSQRKHILTAGSDRVLEWAERLLTAQSWKEVIGGP